MYETFDYEMLEELGTAFTTGSMIMQLGRFALVIAAYVLRSIGLYTIAKRRGIANPWLAWIPVGWVWILGSISDQFRYVTKAQVKNKRITLLVMELIQFVVSIVMTVLMVIAFVDFVEVAEMAVSEDALAMQSVTLVLKFLGFFAVLGGLALAKAIIRFIALYDVYMSVNPANAVLFLVLSILFSITEPFFIFFNRKKDSGMPPRCDVPQPPVAPVSYSYIPETAQEPVEISEEPVAEEPAEEPAEQTEE